MFKIIEKSQFINFPYFKSNLEKKSFIEKNSKKYFLPLFQMKNITFKPKIKKNFLNAYIYNDTKIEMASLKKP